MKEIARAGKANVSGAGSWWLRAFLLLIITVVVLGYPSRSSAEPSRELHWSPDGQYLAASMWWPLKSGVWLFKRDGSLIRKVTDKDAWVQWVEGDRLLTGPIVLNGDESWSLIELEGKSLEVIYPDLTPQKKRHLLVGNWKTSPDGRYLAYTCVYSP